MNINNNGSLSKVSDSMPNQNSSQQMGKDSPTRHSHAFKQQFHDLGQEYSSSDSMEIFEGRHLAVVKTEQEDSDHSMNVEEVDEIKVKKEPGLEECPKKLLGIRTVKDRVKLINLGYDIEKEKGIENCLPCAISFYNWILSGSDYPEPVDPDAKPMHEHMVGSNTAANLLNDPHLEKLNNPKEVIDVDAEGGKKEYVNLTEDIPLTFIPVRLGNLRQTVAKEVGKGGVAWKKYEKDGEKFKLGILFLNHKEDDEQGHFLAFLYRKSTTPAKNKTKQPEYNLYIIDPQSSEISEFSGFDKKSYADNIYMWTGQNRINYDCNKTLKQIFEELKKEEGIEKPNQLDRIDNVATCTKLKNKPHKRANDEDLESEVSKKPKSTYDLETTNNNSNASKIHSSPEKNRSPVKSGPNHWERLSNLKPLQLGFEDFEDFEGIETYGMDVDNKTLMRKPFHWNSDASELLEFNGDLETDYIEKVDDFVKKSGPVNHNGDVDIYTNDMVIETDEVAKGKEIISGELELNEFNDASVQFQPSPSEKDQGLSSKKITEGTSEHVEDKAALKRLRKSANSGDVAAQIKLGKMHSTGDGVKRYGKLAEKYFKMAADDAGNPEAQGLLGEMYLKGGQILLNFPEALKYLKLGAKGRDAFSLHNLANMYKEGIGVVKNYDKYIKYEKLAAEAGNVDSQLRLAYLQTDIIEKIKWLKLAANQKSKIASEALGTIYYSGAEGVPEDKQQALTYYKISAGGVPEDNHQATYFKITADGAEGGPEDSQQDTYIRISDAGGFNDISKERVELRYLHEVGVASNLVEAVKYLEPVAHKSALVAKDLGLIYYNGLGGVPQDFKKAFDFFKMAAEQGDVVSKSYVGRMLFDGKGTQQNIYEAYNPLRFAADKGDLDASAYLGSMFYDGLACPLDLGQAYFYSKPAADQGNPMAQFILGLLHRRGLEGVINKNLQEAVKYLMLSADGKYSKALNNLAGMYLIGEGVPKDFAEYIRYTRLAAEGGHQGSQYDLGMAYLNGEGVERNVVEAAKWFKLAKLGWSTLGSYQLGLICYKGAEGVPQDMQQAREGFQIAADNGHVDSQAYLARMCLHGVGGPLNTMAALNYSLLASKSGNPIAQGVLGTIYIEGLGCIKNESLGLGYLIMAKKSNDALAQTTLGYLYKMGNVSGIPKKISKSLKYLSNAANLGFARAQAILGEMYLIGEDVEKDLEKAYYYTQLAVNQGDWTAVGNLAKMYLKGDGVKKDVTEALNCLNILVMLVGNFNANDLGNFELGGIYLNGEEGIPQNFAEAFKYYNLCAHSINTDPTFRVKSQRIIGDMFSKGLGVLQNLYLSFTYTKLAAEKGDLEAEYNLAQMYYKGLGTARDLPAAMKYYNLAAGKGHLLAQQALQGTIV